MEQLAAKQPDVCVCVDEEVWGLGGSDKRTREMLWNLQFH